MNILNRKMLALALVGSMSMVLVQMVVASVPFKGTGAGEITNVQPGPRVTRVTLNPARSHAGNQQQTGTFGTGAVPRHAAQWAHDNSEPSLRRNLLCFHPHERTRCI